MTPDIGMEWWNTVWLPSFLRRERQTSPTTQMSLPAGNQQAKDIPPDLVQLVEEAFVAVHMTKLVRAFVVTFERPIRRRCEDEVNG